MASSTASPMKGVGFLFPGQGSQSPGMGRALFDAYPESRAVFEEADEVLGERLSRLCFEGPEEELRLTRNTQPALLTVSVAALSALTARGASFDFLAGHSLGEYSALVAAGALDFADAVRLTRARGDAMQRAVPAGEGAMAAVLGLSAEVVVEVCARFDGGAEGSGGPGGVVEAANFNGAGQVVIGGHREAVAAAGEALSAAGARRVVPLPVSAPFHTRLMAPAAAELAPRLEETPFADLAAPLWTNADARPIRTGAEARDALRRQIASPVRWEETLRGMEAAGAGSFVEVGAGRVLAGLARKVVRGARTASVGDADSLESFLGRAA